MRGGLSSDLLARCLDDLEAGRVTLEGCLAGYPDEAAELRGLVEVRQAISLPPLVVDRALRQRGRVALLEAIATEKQRQANAPLRRLARVLTGDWAHLLPPRNLVPVPLLIALVLAFTIAVGGGAAYASQDALPGDALYGVKTTVEGLQLALAGSDEAKAESYLGLATKRVLEIERASQADRGDAAQIAAEAFVEEVAQAEHHLVRAAASGKDMEALLARLEANLAHQQAVLEAVRQKAPDQAKAALAHAASAARHGLAQAESAVSGTQTPADAATSPATPTPPATVAEEEPTRTPRGGPAEGGPRLERAANALAAAAQDGDLARVTELTREFREALDEELADPTSVGPGARQSASEAVAQRCRNIRDRLLRAYDKASDAVRPALMQAIEAANRCIEEMSTHSGGLGPSPQSPTPRRP